MKKLEKMLKDLVGEQGLETLKKGVYRRDSQSSIETIDIFLPLLVVPRAIMSWLVQNIQPIPVGESKVLQFPGKEDIKINIEKQGRDSYRAEFTQNGKVIHSLENQTLPNVGGHLLTIGEMYDSFTDGKKPEKEEKPEKESDSHSVTSTIMEMADPFEKPSQEDSEKIKWEMSHANVKELTGVIGKLVDALVSNHMAREEVKKEEFGTTASPDSNIGRAAGSIRGAFSGQSQQVSNQQQPSAPQGHQTPPPTPVDNTQNSTWAGRISDSIKRIGQNPVSQFGKTDIKESKVEIKPDSERELAGKPTGTPKKVREPLSKKPITKDEIDPNQKLRNMYLQHKAASDQEAIKNAKPTHIKTYTDPEDESNKFHVFMATRPEHERMIGAHHKLDKPLSNNLDEEHGIQDAIDHAWSQGFDRLILHAPAAPESKKQVAHLSVIKEEVNESVEKGDVVDFKTKKVISTDKDISSKPKENQPKEVNTPYKPNNNKALYSTSSGKPIHYSFEHPSHVDFSPQDHLDAARAHDNYSSNISNSDLIAHHADQMDKHLKAIGFDTESFKDKSSKLRSNFNDAEKIRDHAWSKFASSAPEEDVDAVRNAQFAHTAPNPSSPGALNNFLSWKNAVKNAHQKRLDYHSHMLSHPVYKDSTSIKEAAQDLKHRISLFDKKGHLSVIKAAPKESMDAPAGAAKPQMPKMPKPSIAPSKQPKNATAKQGQVPNKKDKLGPMMVPPSVLSMPKRPSAPKAPILKKEDYFRKKLTKTNKNIVKNEKEYSISEQDLYTPCIHCGIPEFSKSENGPKYRPCACFYVTMESEAGNKIPFVEVIKKMEGSFALRFNTKADPEVVQAFLLTLRNRLLEYKGS